MALEVNLIGVNNGIYKVAVIKGDEPEKRPEHMFLYRTKDIFSTM